MSGRLLAPVLALAACRAAPIPPVARYPAGTGLEAKTLVADGTRIRYVAAGAGPAVVLIHGFGGFGASMYTWRHTIGPLAAAGFHVIAFDNRGSGFSDKPATGYGNADYTRLVVALLDSLHITDAVLVGHSMGGEIAAEVALAHPERVRALALLDAAGWDVKVPVVAGRLAPALVSRALIGRILRATYADPARVTEADVDQYYAPVREPGWSKATLSTLSSYRFDALRGRLIALQAPTLLLWGAEDRIIPPAVGRRMAAELPRAAFVVVRHAGHAALEERPDEVNALLLTFLREGLPRVPANLAWSKTG
jgi:pimeloyl-ACP methyl ester carboxylesterase